MLLNSLTNNPWLHFLGQISRKSNIQGDVVINICTLLPSQRYIKFNRTILVGVKSSGFIYLYMAYNC